MKWYKASNNLISDSELKLISHKAGVKHYVTVVTFHSLLERCSRNGSSIFPSGDTLAEEISIELGIDASEIDTCLSWLERHKKIKGNMLVNWEIYQESTSTQRVREWRERKANETLHNVSNVSVTDVTQRRGEENRVDKKERNKTPKEDFWEPFGVFWRTYPRKEKRADAYKAYVKALKKTSHDEIIAGVDRYLKNKPAYAAWAHPTSWLNAERWNDNFEAKVSLIPQAKSKNLVAGSPEWELEMGSDL